MIDNLQDAYSAYQNALYHLRDPKVGSLEILIEAHRLTVSYRSPSSGTVSVYSTTDMVHWTMLKKHSRKL